MLTQLQELFSNGNKLYLPLLLFLLLDYATGVCVAVKKRELSSSIGFKGLTKKALIFVVVFLGCRSVYPQSRYSNRKHCDSVLFVQ